MSSSVLTFAIVGEGDAPIFEADLAAPPSAAFADATVVDGDDDGTDDGSGGVEGDSTSSSTQQQPSARDERAAYLHQFILHAALDAVDEVLWTASASAAGGSSSSSSSTAASAAAASAASAAGSGPAATTSAAAAAAAGAGGAPHLGVVDRFNALQVSAYATPGSLRLLLLHDGRPDDVVRGFFREVHELLVKARLNPFFVAGSGRDSKALVGCCGSSCDGSGISGPLAARGGGFDRRVRSLARSHFRVMV